MNTANESFLSSYSSYVNSLPSFQSDSFSSNLSSMIESHYDLRNIYDENGNRIENNSNEFYYEDDYKDNVDNNGDEIEESIDPESMSNLRRFRSSRINRLNNRITSYNRIYRYRPNSNNDNINVNVQRNVVRQADEVSLIVPRAIRAVRPLNTISNNNNENSSSNNENRNNFERILDRSLTASPTPLTASPIPLTASPIPMTASPTPLTRSDYDTLTVNRYTSHNAYQLSPFSSRYHLQERPRNNLMESPDVNSTNSPNNNNTNLRRPSRRNALRVSPAQQPPYRNNTSNIASNNPIITVTNDNGMSSLLNRNTLYRSENSSLIESNNVNINNDNNENNNTTPNTNNANTNNPNNNNNNNNNNNSSNHPNNNSNNTNNNTNPANNDNDNNSSNHPSSQESTNNRASNTAPNNTNVNTTLNTSHPIILTPTNSSRVNLSTNYSSNNSNNNNNNNYTPITTATSNNNITNNLSLSRNLSINTVRNRRSGITIQSLLPRYHNNRLSRSYITPSQTVVVGLLDEEGKIIDKSQSYINYNNEFDSSNDNIIHSVIKELNLKFSKSKSKLNNNADNTPNEIGKHFKNSI